MQMTLRSAALLFALPLLSSAAFGAGGSDAPGTPTPPTCAAGKVWDKTQKKCVPKTSMSDDESIFETGRTLAYAGRYDEAIEMLTLASNKGDPRILNMLGYSHRKSGRIDVGLGYYEEALRIDPNFTLVREYLGEAHLQRGDIVAARAQLGEIEKRCGTGCAEYAELARQIDAFAKKG